MYLMLSSWRRSQSISCNQKKASKPSTVFDPTRVASTVLYARPPTHTVDPPAHYHLTLPECGETKLETNNMKHETFPFSTEGNQSDAAAPVRRFVWEHRDSLWHAAHLLGGYDAAKKVGHLAEALAQQACLSRRTKCLLEDLLELLRLEHVGNPDRPEMEYFAAIDPNDSAVDEICVLTDGLSRAIDVMQARERDLDHIDHKRRGAA